MIPPRLLLYPLLASLVGDKDFGVLILAMAFVNLIGQAPSDGLHGFMLREAAKYEQKDQELMLRTMFVMSFALASPAVLFLGFSSGYIGRRYDLPLLDDFIRVLASYVLLLNLLETLLGMHRIHRKFHIVTSVHAIQGGFIFSAIPLYLLLGIRAVPFGWVVGTLVAVICSCFILRQQLFRRPFFNGNYAKRALGVWCAFSLSAFMAVSAGRIDRLLLGYWWDAEVVAVFFAVVSVAAVFALPGQFISGFMSNLLGKVRTRESLSEGLYIFYAVFVVLFSIGMFSVGRFCGKVFLQTFYPNLASRALPLWNLAVASYSLVNIHLLCRPFVNKFLTVKAIPVLTAVRIVSRIVPILVLVPTRGQRGAVEAFLAGSTVTSAMYYGVYLKSFVFRSRDRADESAEQEIQS